MDKVIAEALGLLFRSFSEDILSSSGLDSPPSACRLRVSMRFQLSTVSIRSSLARLTVKYPQMRTIGENISWLTFGRFFRMGIGIFVSAWVGRYLGPSDFGLLNRAAALVAIVSVVAALGIDSIAKSELIRHPESKRKILGTVWWFESRHRLRSHFS